MTRFVDSVEKIKNYLISLDREVLYFSPFMLRTLVCNKSCGACCRNFSLDYLKSSKRWEKFIELYPEKEFLFMERRVDDAIYMTYTQPPSFFCSFLSKDNEARCTIHHSNPFSCSFEIIKIQGQGNYTRYGIDLSQIVKKRFGREWNMTQVDGSKGTKCEIVDFNQDEWDKDLLLLEELQQHYLAHYGIENKKLFLLLNKLKFDYDVNNPKELYFTSEGERTKDEILKMKTKEKWW